MTRIIVTPRDFYKYAYIRGGKKKPRKTKTINGEKFQKSRTLARKRSAEIRADKLRYLGWNARVIKDNDGYTVWRSVKKR